MLSIIILILVLLKTCENNECDPACTDIDDRLNNINILLDSCDCEEVPEIGCLDSNYQEYDPDADYHDQSFCLTDLRKYGCMDDTYQTYDPNANTHDKKYCKNN